MATLTLVELDNVSIQLGRVQALREVNLALQSGEIVTVVGKAVAAKAPWAAPCWACSSLFAVECFIKGRSCLQRGFA